MREIIVNNMLIKYNTECIKIVNSYMVNNTEDMNLILKIFKMRTGYCSKRSIKSWVKEWKAHNRLYKLGLFKKHTIDCDLEENEKWWILLIYQILGM